MLLIHVQTLVSQAWRGLFEKFKNPESTDGSVPAMGKGSRSISTQEGELCPIKLCDAPQALGNYTPKKPYLWPGVMFLRNSKTQNQKFGVLWLWNRVPGHWPPRGANYGHSKEPRLVFSDFLGGLLIRSIYLGMLPTQYPH